MKVFALAFFIVLLSGCATQPLPRSEGEVVARYGQPSEEWQQPDGTRVLMYADTPLGYGSTRYIVDKDHAVIAVEPVINDEHFARLKAGMTEEDVRHELGRPGERAAYRNLNEYVWSWRYLEFGNRRMFFNAHFDSSSGRLKHTSRTPEPEPHFRTPFGFGMGLGF
jgi:hypothetical protein